MSHDSESQKRLMVISLDGFPYTLLRHYLEHQQFPHLRSLLNPTSLHQMHSVYPTVSSVAWSTYMSGRNPGNHGIFGFVDLDPATHRLTLPNASHRTGKTIWDTLGENGLESIVVNIPVTYPPTDIRGAIISGFLGVNLGKSVQPASLLPLLESSNYRIDADTGNASNHPDNFILELESIVKARCNVFKQLLKQYPWSFAHLHIMETDRLFHFLWSHVKNSHSTYHSKINHFMHCLDQEIGAILDMNRPDDRVILLSDHGFDAAELEFDINAWLSDHDWLQWETSEKKGMDRIADSSRAFSLLPGRLYVKNSSDITTLTRQLLSIHRPHSKKPVFQDVLPGHSIYHGRHQQSAPDIVAVPAHGIELKGRLSPGPQFQPSRLQGTHTFHDAFVWIKNGTITSDSIGIIDLFPTILNAFSLHDKAAEGICFVNW